MERLIERRIIDALCYRKPLATGASDTYTHRDVVRVLADGSVVLKLHGHVIGEYDAVYNVIKLRTFGHETRTTKSRLNCFAEAFNLGVSFVIRNKAITPIGKFPAHVYFHNF